jgi:hypothetical protein
MAMASMTLSTTLDPPAPQGVVAPASRWLGAGVAFSIAFVAGLIGLGFDAPYLLLGVPAATIAGALLGPGIDAWGGIGRMSVAMALETTAIADALVVMVAGAASLARSPGGGVDPLTSVAGAVAFWGIGLFVVGIPMLIVTVPCGLAWAVLVRMLARRSR